MATNNATSKVNSIRTRPMIQQMLLGAGGIVFSLAAQAQIQLPPTCKAPASAAHPPAGTPPAQVYDAVGVWFAQNGNLNCAVAAFKGALRLEPNLAEAHFDLGLVHQSQHHPDAAASEFRLALKYDASLKQAHCALGSSLSDPAEAEAEFRSALATDPNLVCALDGLAQTLARERRFEAALDYWRQALRLQPDAPDMQLALATAMYKAAKARQSAGQPALDGMGAADAIVLLTELVKAHPDLIDAYFTLGNIYANERRNREAADEYHEVVLRDPSNTVALAAQVKALIDASAFSEALAPARAYVQRKPNDPSGHIMLGTVYQQLGDYAKAQPELELGVAKAPDDFEARYQLGLVLSRMEKPRQALPHLRKAVALRPDDRAAQYQLVAVLRSLGQTQEASELVAKLRTEQNQESLSSQLATEGTKANDLLQSGQAKEAVEIYRHMLDEKPDSALTAYNLALALEATHDSAGAEDTLRKALSLDPKQANILAELGRLELADGHLQPAQDHLRAALDVQPELVEARGNLAMIDAQKGDLLAAEKLLRQALEGDPNFKEGHLNLGLILAQQNRKSDAEKELSRAAALAPKDPATLSTVGKAELRMGNSNQGIALLRQVVDLAPNLAAAHLDLGLALADTYNLPAALEQAGEAVRLAPQSAVAHFYRGRVLFDLGRNSEAQSEFENAIRLDPKMAEPRYFLALIDRQDGKFDQAAGLLTEAVRLKPNNVMAWYMLGQSLDKIAQADKAIGAWRKAIEIDPNFSQALFSLSRALQPTDPAEADKLMARYMAVQKERRILDRADTLANNGVEAASAHDWPGAIQQLKQAIAACGECAAQADLHRKLGIIECQAGDLDKGEKDLLAARALKPSDPITQAALDLVAQARRQQSAAMTGKKP